MVFVWLASLYVGFSMLLRTASMPGSGPAAG